MSRSSRRARTIGTREAQPKQFPALGTPRTRWEFSQVENLLRLVSPNVHMTWPYVPPISNRNFALMP
jgi:hypothetical protein